RRDGPRLRLARHALLPGNARGFGQRRHVRAVQVCNLVGNLEKAPLVWQHYRLTPLNPQVNPQAALSCPEALQGRLLTANTLRNKQTARQHVESPPEGMERTPPLEMLDTLHGPRWRGQWAKPERSMGRLHRILDGEQQVLLEPDKINIGA